MYKTIKKSFWTDLKVRGLSPIEKLLFLYLITNPHAHYSGIYYLPMPLAELETGANSDVINTGLKTLQSKKLVKFDNELNIVWIINMAKHQLSHGNKANLIKGISNHLKTLHESKLVQDFLNHYKDLGMGYTIPSEWDTPSHANGCDMGLYIYTDKDKKKIPADFGISERVKKWAKEKGHSNLEEHLEYFISVSKAKGYKYVDWDEALMNAIRRNWAKIDINDNVDDMPEKIRRAKEEYHGHDRNATPSKP